MLEAKGIAFHLWNTHRISGFVAQDAHLVDRYFGRYWVEAISADVRGASPTVEAAAPLREPGDRGSILAQLQTMIDSEATGLRLRLSAVMAERLDRAIESVRSGSSQPFEAWLSEARQDAVTWEGLDAGTRAKALRTAALLRLRSDEVEAARQLLDEAGRISPAPDLTALALVIRRERGVDAAIDVLASPASVREREVKAGLLIEAGRAQDALSELTVMSGVDVSAEVLRLRAIARSLAGERDRAIRDAISATERAPDEAFPLLTLGIVRLFSSLAPGVVPQFSRMPHPIDRGLLMSTRAARDLLGRAISDFERVEARVEAPLRRDVKIWRLAALLLHPDRREEADRFAQVPLRRETPEPLAVAWALSHGVLRRRGRIKKAMGDAVRSGRGSPSHLVVLAQLSASPTAPQRGLNVIRRYEYLFPDAADFLRGWRAQFGDIAADDDGYAAAVHRSLRDGSNGPLVQLLNSPDSTVEQAMSGAEFLSWREAWGDLDRLGGRLAAIGTGRAVELAALAALRAGRPEGCIAVLRQAEGTFDGARLPSRLVYLRIRANEALGEHRPVIDDLLSLRSEGRDPHIALRLMDAYLKVGKLDDYRVEAERALEHSQLDAGQALHVAHALRSHAPATARRALLRAAQGGVRQELVGAALSLASELGASDVQDRMLRAVAALAPGTPGGFIRIDTVEEALAFIEERSREYRDTFGEWLAGRRPAALAMRHDLRSFGLLFLAAAGRRRNQVGDEFPMLLLSGARRPPAAAMPDERPVLRLDLSALLLASHLDLLADVERVFAVRVAVSTAEALRELAAELKAVDQDLVRAVRDVLSPGRSAVRTVEGPCTDAVPVESADDPLTLDADVTRALLERAFREGHLGRDRMDEALLTLGVAGAAAERSVTAAVLSPSSLYRLAGAGVLEPVARATPLLLPADVAERVGTDLDASVHEDEIRTRVIGLLAKVSEELGTGAWKSVGLAAPEDEERAARLPAHLRCLVEILEAQKRSATAFWVEDRALSHARLEGAVSVFDVVSHLRDRDVISDQRRRHLLDVLRDSGYAFMPIDQGEILRKVEAAPLNQGRLVETPDLSELRAWVARDIGCLVHVDHAMRVMEDGSVGGEIRRTVDLLRLAPILLSRIWADPDASLDDKRGRSAWVWTNLRLELSPSLPVWSDSEAWRDHVAITLAHTLDAPLLDLFSGDGIPKAAQQAFVHWFMAYAVEPMTDADPALADKVVEVLARMVDGLIGRAPDLGGPEVEQVLARRLLTAASTFLDLLPDHWDTRIVEHHDLGQRLGREATMVLNLDEKNAVVDSLAPAWKWGPFQVERSNSGALEGPNRGHLLE